MPDSTQQLYTMILEYLYYKSARVEKEYYESVDRLYKILMMRYPEKRLENYEILNLIDSTVKYRTYFEIQRDILDILKMYKDQ